MSLPLLREEARERRLVAPFGSQLRSTNKTLPDFLLASKQIVLIGEGQEPWSLSDSWLPRWGSCPLLGRGPSHRTSFLGADERPREPLVSVSLLSSQSAFPAPGGLRTSFKECFPLPLVLLPLLKSLYFSLSSPFAFPDSGCRAATASLLAASVTCSLWPPTAHLNRRQTGVGEAHLTPCRPWSSRLP